MLLSVIMPVYNERATIEKIIQKVQASAFAKEIIIIDDCSSDGTRELLKQYEGRPEFHIIYHARNQGKGASLRTGFEQAEGDFLVIQDADLEYDPEEYKVLLGPLIDGRADVVYGSRFLGGPHRVLYYWHYVGNRLLTIFSNALSNINLSDMETCYKAFRREVLQKIEVKSDRFGFEPEFTMKVAKNHYRIYEVPISYSGRTYQEGKKVTWKDGVKAIFALVWYRFFD